MDYLFSNFPTAISILAVLGIIFVVVMVVVLFLLYTACDEDFEIIDLRDDIQPVGTKRLKYTDNHKKRGLV